MNNVIIIAEAGVNHNGSIDLAKKLIDAAVNAGVDFVKFQTFKADNLVIQKSKKATYQKETTDKLIELIGVRYRLKIRVRYRFIFWSRLALDLLTN